jgi:hypothetical protein
VIQQHSKNLFSECFFNSIKIQYFYIGFGMVFHA